MFSNSQIKTTPKSGFYFWWAHQDLNLGSKDSGLWVEVKDFLIVAIHSPVRGRQGIHKLLFLMVFMKINPKKEGFKGE
jgi:hypothetical protein